MAGDKDVIALTLHINAQTTEGIGDDTQLIVCYALYQNAIAYHSGHTYERAHLNHVRQDGMFCTAQFLHTLNGQQVTAYTADVGTHLVEHLAELLDIGLTGCIIYCSGSFCHNSCHNYVGGSCYRGLIKKHITSLQTFCSYGEDTTLGIIFKFTT